MESNFGEQQENENKLEISKEKLKNFLLDLEVKIEAHHLNDSIDSIDGFLIDNGLIEADQISDEVDKRKKDKNKE